MLDRSEPALGSLGSLHSVPRVVLAGSPLCFSDRILSLLQDEFRGFHFERLDLHLHDGAISATNLHLIICEEATASLALSLPVKARAGVAVAFHDMPSVTEWLAVSGLDRLPRGLSLLPMNVRVDAWLSIMRLLLDGEPYVPVDVIRWLGQGDGSVRLPVRPPMRPEGPAEPRPHGTTRDDALRKLTERERKVLPLIAQGKQNKVIADELDMSEHTVKLHVHHIIGKLGVRNRTEAARFYLSLPPRTAES